MGQRPRALQRTVEGALVVGAFGLAIVSAHRILTSPEDTLLRLVPDDAFYYLQIAKNIVDSGRSTADGVSMTNGYHPLWMAVSVVLAAFSPDNERLLRAALGASLVLHVCVALLLGYAVALVVDKEWGVAAAGCWVVNPLAYLIALQAVEATVYALALVIVFLLYVRLFADVDPAHSALQPQRIWQYGAALGMLCLARTEGLVVAALAFVHLASVLATAASSWRRAAATLLSCGASFVGVLAPWLLFSWWTVGTIAQDSGVMKAIWASDASSGFADRIHNLAATMRYFWPESLRFMTGSTASPRVLLLVCGLTCAILGAIAAVDRRRLAARVIAAWGLPAVALTLIYGSWFVERQIWWLVFPCLCIVTVTLVAVPTLLDRMRVRVWVHGGVRAGLVVLSMVLFIKTRPDQRILYPWQPDVRRSQHAIDELVPATERIGYFNAGIPMFYSSRPAIALEGIVSHEALRFWKDRQLDEFLRQEHVQYIADEQRTLNLAMRFVRARPTFTRMSAYPLRDWPTHERVLWRCAQR